MNTWEAEAAGPLQPPETPDKSAGSCDAIGQTSVSTVMVTYRTGPLLFEAIEAVLSQDGLCELILVDNGNPPEVVAEIERCVAKDDRLILLSGHGNIGFAAGCNLGAKSAHGEYLLFLNPDCVLPPGGLRDLLAEGIGRPRPWMLGSRVVNPDGSEQQGSRREILTPWIAFVETLRIDRLAPDHPYFKRFNQHTSSTPEKTTAVPVISGACMMLPAEDYWTSSGMDEGYFVHVEDIDFCNRFRVAGGEIFFVPHVAVLHFHSTSAASPLFIEWHKTRGFIRYFRKNFVGIYPPLFLSLVNVGILGRFVWKAGLLLTRGLFDSVTGKRRNRSRRALLTHRAPPSGSGVEAVTGHRMSDPDRRED